MSCHRLTEFVRVCTFVLVGGTMYAAAAAPAINLKATTFEVLAKRSVCSEVLPASTHPYDNTSNLRWTNTCPGAKALEITFDPRTRVEWLYDYVHVTDGAGTNVLGSPFTGGDLAGKTLIVPGDTVIVRLESDGAVPDWGFEVSSLFGLESNPEPIALSRQVVTLFWQVQYGGVPIDEDLWLDSIYVSSTPFWTSGAVPFARMFLQQAQATDTNYSQLLTLQLPAVATGDYFLLLRTDGDGDVQETTETDNEQAVPIRFENADLAGISLSAPGLAAPQEPLSISWTVTNLSSRAALPYWYDNVYIRRGQQSNLVSSTFQSSPVPPGGNYSVVRNLTLPALPPAVHSLEVHVNNSGIAEPDPQNNVLAASITIAVPDLIAVGANAPVAVDAGQWFSASLSVSNGSLVTAFPAWMDALYLSPTNRLTSEAVLVDQRSRFEAVPAGARYTQDFQLSLSAFRTGNLFLIFRVDARTNLFDVNATNSILALPIHVQAPNLVPTRFEVAPSTVFAPNEPIWLSWTVTNQGQAPASPAWGDQVVLATDSAGSNIVASLGTFWQSQATAAMSSYSNSAAVFAPPVPAGNYFLVLKADSANFLLEPDERNNHSSIGVTIAAASLRLESLTAPSSVTPQEPFAITWTVRNEGLTTPYPPWEDFAYIAPAHDILLPWHHLFRIVRTEPIMPGAAYSQTQTVGISSLPTGDYWLVLHSGYRFPPASTETNNIAALPIRIQGPDLVALAITAPSTGFFQTNMQAVLRILNIGPVNAVAPWGVNFYLSPEPRLDPDAVHVGWTTASESLAPGASVSVTAELRFAPLPFFNNTFLIALVDPFLLADPDAENNQVFKPISLRGPDLVAESLNGLGVVREGPAIVAAAQEPLHLYWVVRNEGKTQTVRDWQDTVMLLVTQGFPAVYEMTSVRTNSLSPDASYLQDVIAKLPPVRPGRYELLVRADSAFELEESSEANNTRTHAIRIVSPDLAVVDLQAPPLVDGQSTFPVSWRVTNVSTVKAFPAWTDRLYVSPTNHLTAEAVEVLANVQSVVLSTNDSYSVTQFVTLPALNAGNHFLIARTDADSTLFDTVLHNNEVVVPLSIQRPNLRPVSLAPVVQGALVDVPPQTRMNLAYQVENMGPGTAASLWYDQIYFSQDATLDAQDVAVADVFLGQPPLLAGGSYSNTTEVQIPSVPAGDYFLIVHANSAANLAETDLANNTLAISIRLAAVDLSLTMLAATNQAAPYQPFTVSWSVRNNGPAIALPPWFDALYLSSTPVWSPEAMFIGASQRNDNLLAGSNYTVSTTLAVPAVAPGDYYLIARTDAESNLADSNTVDNFRAISIRVVLADLVPMNLTGLRTNVSCSGPFPESPNPPVRNTVLRWTNSCPGASNLQVTFDADSYLSYNSSFIHIKDGSGSHAAGSPFTGWIDPLRKVLVRGDTALIEFFAGPFGDDRFRITDISSLVETSSLSVPPQSKIAVQWTAANAGAGRTSSAWEDYFYLSTDMRLDDSDVFLDAYPFESSLAPTSSYLQMTTLEIGTIPPGEYQLLLQIDGTDYQSEMNETNNVLALPISVRPGPDLRPIALNVQPTLTATSPFPSVALSWTVTNEGPSRAETHWADAIYLSRDLGWDTNDVLLASIPRSHPLDPAQAYTALQSVTLRLGTGGRYYLLLWVDGPGVCPGTCAYESNETNNIIAALIDIDLRLPDLVITELAVPPLVVSVQDSPQVQFRWVVRNQGPGVVTGAWDDNLYINGVRMFTSHRSGPLEPGATYTNTVTQTLTVPHNSPYSVIVRTDDADDCNCVPENNESNNSGTASFQLLHSPRELVLPGESSTVALWLNTFSEASSVDMDVFVPPEKLTGLTATYGFPLLSAATTVHEGNGHYRLRFETFEDEFFTGQQQISRLRFQVQPNLQSAFIPLLISNVVARAGNGTLVPATARAGRVVIIGSQPLIEITALPMAEHLLTVYGMPGSDVVVETDNRFDSNGWSVVWDDRLTNRFQQLGPYTTPSTTRFYRARY